jgi:hypothetical protein
MPDRSFRAMLTEIRLWYRLSKLEGTGLPDIKVRATLNPGPKDVETVHQQRDAETGDRIDYDEPQKEKKYKNEFKATRTAPKSFVGDYSNFPNWKWLSYTPLQVNVWHPANIHFNRATRVPRPKGKYHVEPGRENEGAVKERKEEWRTYLTEEKNKEKQEIKKNGQPTDRTVPRNNKNDENWAKAVLEKRYWGMDWRDLYLIGKGGTPRSSVGWQEHHINPTNWGGENDVQNMIYIIQEDHHPITTWFETTKEQILDQLDREEESRKS